MKQGDHATLDDIDMLVTFYWMLDLEQRAAVEALKQKLVAAVVEKSDRAKKRAKTESKAFN
eukprot:12059519-Prorocentrum_lima.AAC.1